MEEGRIKLAIKFEKERKNDIIKLLKYFGGKDNLFVGFPGDTYCYIDLDGNINVMHSWNSRIMHFDRFDYSEFIKKIQFIPGDKVTVNLPGFEEHSEKEVGKLEGVTESKVTFLTQKLTVEVDEAKAGTLLNDIKKIVKKVEPDVTVVEK